MLGRRRDALPVIDQIGHACSVTPAKAGVWRLQSARLRHEIPAFAGMTTMRRIFVTSAPTAGRSLLLRRASAAAVPGDATASPRRRPRTAYRAAGGGRGRGYRFYRPPSEPHAPFRRGRGPYPPARPPSLRRAAP